MVKELKRIYYRISDAGNSKRRPALASKEACLENFLWVFKDCRAAFFLVRDNCREETRRWTARMLSETMLQQAVVDSSVGNSGSFRFCMRDAISSLEAEDAAYFVEDDYVHRPGSPQALEEGLGYAEYVSLYDHPDKYTSKYEGGETSKVLLTPSGHWRYTISTCMTFCTTKKILEEDYPSWNLFTQDSCPEDHPAFCALGEAGRRLLIPIPAFATHAEYECLAPHVDWDSYLGKSERS